MNKITKILVSLCTALIFSGVAQAEISFMAARVGAMDVPALAEFYKSAFGLKEVNRLNLPGGQVEIMLNFGNTIDAAKANSNAQVVIMQRESDDFDDPIMHLIFNVSDINTAAAAITAAGGTLLGEPFGFGNTGIKIVFAKDPAGNQVELIQQP